MRHVGPPSEIGRLAKPVLWALDAAWQRMHWWVAAMVVLYAFSGITVVKPDEVAVILRWGRLVGDTPALQEHGPGLLFAFPRPIDLVYRVPVKHVYEVPLATLAGVDAALTSSAALDPLTQGYALTGDNNIVHVQMVARYRIRDAAEWAFYGPLPEDVLRAEVTGAMVRSLGEMEVDKVLTDGRKTLIANATRRAQAGLDAAHSGLELTSLELTRLTPPSALAYEFDAVQSAYIGAETSKKEAQAFAEMVIPKAHADADAAVQGARGLADAQLAVARGDADAFRSLDKEYRANSAVVRERLYRDAVEKAIGNAGAVRWIPPPSGGKYNGFRITVQPSPAGPATSPAAASPAAPTYSNQTPPASSSQDDEENTR
jgi:membrane protease subunit HflK